MDILKISVNFLLIIVGTVSSVFGLILILKPTWLGKLSQGLNKKIFSSDKLQQVLEKERNADQWILNNAKIVGIVFVILGVVMLLKIITG